MMDGIIRALYLATAITFALAVYRYLGSRRATGEQRAILQEKARRYLISAGLMGLAGAVAIRFLSPAAAPSLPPGDPAAVAVPADAAPATTAQDAWTLVPGRGAIGIGPDVSHETLRLRLGDSLVARVRVDDGAGRTVPGTVLFPSDAMRRLEILWLDTARLERPARLRVRGAASRWRLHPGITLGSLDATGQPVRELTVTLAP